MDVAKLALALNAGRVGIGVALTLAPAALGRRWIGPVADDPGARVAIRAMGIRDAALGAATIGTLRATGVGGMGFRVLAGLGIAVDAVDAAATVAAWRSLPASGKAVIAVAGGATALGAAVLARPAEGTSAG